MIIFDKTTVEQAQKAKLEKPDEQLVFVSDYQKPSDISIDYDYLITYHGSMIYDKESIYFYWTVETLNERSEQAFEFKRTIKQLEANNQHYVLKDDRVLMVESLDNIDVSNYNVIDNYVNDHVDYQLPKFSLVSKNFNNKRAIDFLHEWHPGEIISFI